MKLLRMLILRPLWRDPLRTALTAIAVALGVAVVVAIDLSGDAATGSFQASLETLAEASAPLCWTRLSLGVNSSTTSRSVPM